MNSGVITSILGVPGLELHFSGTERVTFFWAQPSLGGHNSCLGGLSSDLGGLSSDLGGTAPKCPRGVEPAAKLRQFIEL